MYKIGIYIPESHLDVVKSAMFAAGAGQIGAYRACSWEIMGQGQFIPSKDAYPYEGSAEVLSQVAEFRVEMVCQKEKIADVINALKKVHPYEEPAYDVVELVDV